MSRLTTLWADFMAQADAALEPPVRSALQDATPIGLEGRRLRIGVPATFSRDFLTKPLNLHRITAVLRTISLDELQPEFIVHHAQQIPRPPAPESAPARVAELPTRGPAPRPRPLHPTPAASTHDADLHHLNPEYTFETFVRGNSNNLAAAAAQAVADASANMYNPLFLYGGVGLGKTHLMHAIGNVVMREHPGSRVVYISAEKFTNEMIEALAENQMKRFRGIYRGVDVLLVDDIQFLINKERTQEEFFHTFNELYNNKRRIVLSSDRPPKQMTTLLDRLRSRFEWGMIADIQPPDMETRTAILRKKAEAGGIPVPLEVTSFIAETIHSNIRELEGALTRILAYSSLMRRPIDLSMAQEALQDVIRMSPGRGLDIPTIQDVVCEYFGLSREALLGRRRDQQVVKPRQIAMYLCKVLLSASYPEIGSHFGGKDHTTVLHAFRKVEENLEDHYFKTSIDNLKDALKQAGS